MSLINAMSVLRTVTHVCRSQHAVLVRVDMYWVFLTYCVIKRVPYHI
jgi:hypothetical protein